MSDIIYFSPYRISTITCNADIGKNINLNLCKLFDNLSIVNDDKQEGIVWIQFFKDECDVSKGTYPKKKRKSKKVLNRKCRFDNQVTIIYRFDEKYIPNVKIFKNGNIQLTGIKDVVHTEKIVNHIIEEIKNIYENITKDIIVDYVDGYSLDLKYQNFKIRMINTDFKIYSDPEMTKGFELRRKEVHRLFINDVYKNKCSFQPGIYQGVKLEYFWNICDETKNGICKCPEHCYGKGNGSAIGSCKKVTGAIFESGSILITGGVTFQQVDDTYRYICNFLTENRDIIKKPLPKINQV